jgi:hypothetical protein
MDFSLNVDTSLHSHFMPSSSSVEFLTQHDFDLAESPSSNVFQTIQPSQLIGMSSSPSPSSSPSATSPSYSSCDSSSGSTSPPPSSQTRSSKRNAVEANKENDDHAGHAKRHQTKLACSWCRKLSKKCDTQRPCGRCVQFNRCSECVDAPPRKPRAKGVDRGTYKKTRELATKDYQEAVARREAYVAKQAKKGRDIRVGLTPDEILERQIKSEAMEARKMDACKMHVQKMLQQLPLMGDDIQGGSLPFTGPLEDLFTCSASPEIEELLFAPSPSVSTPSEHLSVQSSPLFEISSPMTDSTSVTDPDSFMSWEWQTMEKFPIVMELVAAAQVAENSSLFDDAEEIQPWSDYALEA